jgi:hypothetical protein
MAQPNPPVEGGCRCDRVRFRISKPPLLTMACHCRGGQKMTSSAFSLSAAVPADGFEVIQGQPTIGGLHGPSRHYMCPWCMTWMFTRPEGLDGFVNVRSALCDGVEWSEPFVETSKAEALPWATTPAVHSFDHIPDNAAYEPLVAEYAARTGGS